LACLIPKLEANGAISGAKELARKFGDPFSEKFFISGAKTKGPYSSVALEREAETPTAQSWDYIKQSLDDTIRENLGTHTARAAQQVKNELLNAIDNHPDPNVAGIWKQARQTFAAHASIEDARLAGQDLFNKNTRWDELMIQFKNYSEPEKKAFLEGARDELQNIKGDTIQGTSAEINKLLLPNSQKKLEILFGKKNADELTLAMQQERTIKENTTEAIQQSKTQARLYMENYLRDNMQTGVISDIARTAKTLLSPQEWGQKIQELGQTHAKNKEEAIYNALSPFLLKQGPEAAKLLGIMASPQGKPRSSTIDPALRAISTALMQQNIPQIARNQQSPYRKRQ